jgi:AAA+ ATPase superfamily predicted ATPase
MKLHKQQQKALDQFNELGFVYIDGPRRSGKTMLLHEIIKQSKGKVGVFTRSRHWFEISYSSVFGKKVSFMDKNCKTLIGDEFYINYEDARNKKVAVAGTFHLDTRTPPKHLKGTTAENKKVLPKKLYYYEFGKYE